MSHSIIYQMSDTLSTNLIYKIQNMVEIERKHNTKEYTEERNKGVETNFTQKL